MSGFFGTADDIFNLPKVQRGLKGVPPVIEEAFKSLCDKSWSREVTGQIYLNKHIVQHIVESYYLDLYRLTIFRGIVPDHHKQAAFLIKWIIKLRPVQIHADVFNPHLSALLSNECLAITVGLVVLFRSTTNSAQAIINESGYVCNLIYLLHFHSNLSPEQLASELYQLEKRCSNQMECNDASQF